MKEDCLIFVRAEHGTLKIDEEGDFMFGFEKMEFQHDDDPIDRFVMLYNIVYDDIREECKVAFDTTLFAILANVMLWAFIFKDINPICILFWMIPIVVFSIKYCFEYYGVMFVKILGKLCLTLSL